ncbi:MATE family efflux transporter [Candidatus Haliotispira prima]|uniref:MATE family efflux transporter n=1 Tax=Candidatus Haliotispira prima TaxID=3034016 RepID=A0ABY8MJD7_9SPIO|nr:MATE family efflux transporter [Candidatus Haliotispira prima]
MKSQNLNEDLTEGSVRKHMSRLALPSILGSLFTTLYNVVDTVWAGKVGLDMSGVDGISDFLSRSGDVRALTGMTVSFPIFLVMLALSIGLMSGTLALIGNVLGRKDRQKADTYFAQALLYAIAVSVLLLLVLPFLPSLFRLMGADDQVVIGYAHEYISTIIAGSILFSVNFVFTAALIARGDTKTQRNVSIINFFLNIVLDPLFLFGFGPIPAMGLRGIALATLLSQSLGLVVMYVKLRRYHAFAGMSRASFRPRWDILGTIAKQSMPPSMNMAITSFLLGMVNRYAYLYGGSAAVAAYGISLRIEQIALIPGMGVSTALTGIASQNNGAYKIERIKSAYRLALLAGLLFLLFIMLPLGWLFPEAVVRLFTTDAETVGVAKVYLGISVFTFFAYMLITFSGSIFQACQVPYILMYLTVSRSLILPLVTFTLFPVVLKMGLNGLWSAILLNNWLAAIAAFLLCLWILRKRKREAVALRDSES